MFLHNFIYQLKVLLKRREFLFWTLCFPLVLGTFFSLAFSNIESGEMLDTIPIAVCGMEEEERLVLEELKMETGEKSLFSVQSVSKEDAISLLNEKKIDGYIDVSDGTKKVIVLESGINQTVLKRVVEEMDEVMRLTKDFVQSKVEENIEQGNFTFNIESLQEEVKMVLSNEVNMTDNSKKNMSYTMVEFYTLIAMTCLYGGMLGISTINDIQANLSAIGKRVQVSCSKKKQLILSSILSSYLVELVGLILLFLYTIFVLHIDYGSNLGLIILLSVVGSLAGMSLGIFIASCLKVGENTKTGILISLTMLGCFFSGMMGIGMKYVIDKNVPIINLLNPANMITDGFYALYHYESLNRYIGNVVSLLIVSILLLTISYFSLRRQKYDSI